MHFVRVSLLLALTYVSLQATQAQDQPLGPHQVCHCYPAGSRDVSASSRSFVRAASQSKCTSKSRVDISIVADDGVILWICGKNVRQTSNFDEIQTFTFDNPCDDFIFEVNNKELSSGVALLATFNGQKYGTTDSVHRVPGTDPLFAIAKFQPGGDWRNNPSGYDFSSWTPAVVVSTILGHGPNFDFLARQGAYPINVSNGNVSSGIYALKLSVPFCT